MVLPENPVKREFPWCTVFLVAGALSCHTLVMLGNHTTAGTFNELGASTRGWSIVGLELAGSMTHQLDTIMLNVTGQLTSVLNGSMAAKAQLDNAFYMIGNLTDMVVNLTQTSLTSLQDEGHDPSAALFFDVDEFSRTLDRRIVEVFDSSKGGQPLDIDYMSDMLANSIQSHKERVQLLQMEAQIEAVVDDHMGTFEMHNLSLEYIHPPIHDVFEADPGEEEEEDEETDEVQCETTHGDACLFPFSYNGKLQERCSYENALMEDMPHGWCATDVDGQGHMKPGMWGRCSESCANFKAELEVNSDDAIGDIKHHTNRDAYLKEEDQGDDDEKEKKSDEEKEAGKSTDADKKDTEKEESKKKGDKKEKVKKDDKKKDEKERAATPASAIPLTPAPKLKPNKGLWTDLGVGCCGASRDAAGGRIYAGRLATLDACQAKCEGYWNCGVVEYGFSKPAAEKDWCFIWSVKRMCDNRQNGTDDCGGRGGDTVHSYKFSPWKKVGDGCVDKGRDVPYLKLGAGKQPSLAACQDQCTNVPYCGGVEYGWGKGDKEWCFIWTTSQSFSKLSKSTNGCDGRGGDNGVAAYQYRQWLDLGPGCCKVTPRDASTGRLYAGRQDTLADCQAKCTQYVDCGIIEYGWTKGDKKWCFIWSVKQSCDNKDTETKGCGGRGGDNGVRSYGFLGVSTATLTTTPSPTWKDLGPGCCADKSRDSKGGRVYAGRQPTLDACKEKCVAIDMNCSFIEYGWTKREKDWCFIWSDKATCKKRDTRKTGCGGRGGNNGVRTYQYTEWIDLGEGCCDGPRDVGKIFAGDMPSLGDCKAKCKNLTGCSFIEYGWQSKGNSNFCFIWSNLNQTCAKLNNTNIGCGDKGGDNGVRAYRFTGMLLTTTTTTTTTTTINAAWSDVGAGCCYSESRNDSRRLFAGETLTREDCFSKCESYSTSCGIVEYGWTKNQPKWCFIWNTSQDCFSRDIRSTGCGDRGGDNGVHAYMYMANYGSTTTTTRSYDPEDPLIRQWTDIGAGCCAGGRDESDGKIFGGPARSLDDCKAKCMKMGKGGSQCKWMEWGYQTGANSSMWRPTNWCTLWSDTQKCLTLNTSNTACGGMGGHSGVHTYLRRRDKKMCKKYKLDCSLPGNEVAARKIRRELIDNIGDLRGALYVQLQNVTNVTMSYVSVILNKFFNLIEPALLQIGDWLSKFGEKIQTVIEGFGSTMDKVTKILDQIMTQVASTSGKAKVEYNTFTLFDMGGTGSITVDDLKSLGKAYGIQALDGDKSEALFTKYDQNEDDRVDRDEFSRMVEDDSVPGCMCVVLRAYSKKLAQIAGNLQAATLRDEVAKAVVEYLTHISAKNRTKVQWIANRLTNGTVPREFTADIMKQLAQAADDPANVTNADVGQLVIAEMVALDGEFVSDTVELMSDPIFWESEGFDPTDQPKLVERVTGWIAGAAEYLQNMTSFNYVFGSRSGKPVSFEQRAKHLSDMPSTARKLVEERSKRYHDAKKVLFAERMRALQEPMTSEKMFETFLGGSPSSASNDDPTATAAVNSGLPAATATLKFAAMLAANASATAKEFNFMCMDYMGDSSSQLDSFANGIQGMTKKLTSFLRMMQYYSTTNGIQRLRNQIFDLDKYAVDGIMSWIDSTIIGPASIGKSNSQGTVLLGVPREVSAQPVTPVFMVISTVLNTMQSILPTVIDDLKFARKGVSAVASQLDSIFNVTGDTGPPVFDGISRLYKSMWTLYYVFFVALTLGLLFYGFWSSGYLDNGPEFVSDMTEAERDAYEHPATFQDKLNTVWRSCCFSLRAAHDTMLCFWSCIIFMEVVVLVLFINAILLTLLSGIKAYIISGCSTVYFLGDTEVCTGVLEIVQSWLSKFWSDKDLSSVCDDHLLTTCTLISGKMRSAVLTTTFGSLVAAILSFEMVIQSSILHEQSRWRYIVAELNKDV